MENKPRKFWIAGLLSLLEPGLGQIYNGQARKGIFFLVLPLLFLPLMSLFINSNKILNFIITFALLTAVYYIISVGDAIHTARKFKTEYNLKKYNKVITRGYCYCFHRKYCYIRLRKEQLCASLQNTRHQ